MGDNADVRMIKSDVGAIKGTLGQLSPKIEEMHAALPHLATKSDLSGYIRWTTLAAFVSIVIAAVALGFKAAQ